MYIFYTYINSKNNIEILWVPDYLSTKIDRLLSVGSLSTIIAKVPDNYILETNSCRKLEKEIKPWFFFCSDDYSDDYGDDNSPIKMSEVQFDYVSKCDKEILQYLIEQWSVYSWKFHITSNRIIFLRENLDKIYDYATVKDIIE